MKKIEKIKLSDQLVDQIILLIEEKKWDLGMRLPGEIQLAESFNVSRNTLREALKILEVFGVLDSKPGTGTFVHLQAHENIHNMNFLNYLKDNTSVEAALEFRLMIEPKAAYFAALRITDDEIIELKKISEDMLEKYKNDQDHQDDFELHMKIAEYSRNPLCYDILSSLLNQLRLSLYSDFKKHSNKKTADENKDTHRLIVDAIINNEANLAESLMLQHLKTRIKIINPEFEVEPNR